MILINNVLRPGKRKCDLSGNHLLRLAICLWEYTFPPIQGEPMTDKNNNMGQDSLKICHFDTSEPKHLTVLLT